MGLGYRGWGWGIGGGAGGIGGGPGGRGGGREGREYVEEEWEMDGSCIASVYEYGIGAIHCFLSYFVKSSKKSIWSYELWYSFEVYSFSSNYSLRGKKPLDSRD